MRCRHLLFALALSLPVSVQSQSAPRASGVERFDVTGLPATASSTLEKEIFTLIRYHRRGDLKDAARIHLMLAEYYKLNGEAKRADDCNKMAAEAWEAAENGVRVSAGTRGTPPFESIGTFRQNFAYTDPELDASHRWEFFEDGTYAHSLPAPAGQAAPPPKELGFYSVLTGQIRLWQPVPAIDRTVSFELLGEGGRGGAVLEGIRMRAVR
ncbi:MAG TPA: hypothetical protein VFD64_19775 [Gemmatimonadaceae bacterium]|nr:hypothetical protein [Gemmatimonadaceae bacterium]